MDRVITSRRAPPAKLRWLPVCFIAVAVASKASALEAAGAPTEPVSHVLARAEHSFERGSFREAQDGYEEVVRGFPASPEAARAVRQLRYLSTHGEGDFSALETLFAYRRAPPRDRDGLLRYAAQASRMPDGPCRAELRLLCAHGLLALPSPAAKDTLPLLSQAASDALADPAIRTAAAADIVTVHLNENDEVGAWQALRAYEAPLGKQYARTRMRLVQRASLKGLAVATLVGLLVWVRRRPRPRTFLRTLRITLTVGFALLSALLAVSYILLVLLWPEILYPLGI